MKKFEYKVLNSADTFWLSNFQTEKVEQGLNELGLQGWELVAISKNVRVSAFKTVEETNFLLKRELV